MMICDYLRGKFKGPVIRDTGELTRKNQRESFVKGFLCALFSEIPDTFMIFNRDDYISGYAEGSIYRDTINGLSPFCLLIHRDLLLTCQSYQ